MEFIHVAVSTVDGRAQSVCLVRDELQAIQSISEVTNLLGRELAPLNIWRTCAVEFYRQGYKEEFKEILKEITKTIETEPDVANSYRSGQNGDTFQSDMIDIYNSLAAGELDRLQELSSRAIAFDRVQEDAIKDEIIKSLRSAEDLGGYTGNTYLDIIKGFYHLRTGEIRTAANLFERKKKDSKRSKGNYDFALSVGLGIVSYAKNDFGAALEFFVHALGVNVECGASIRMAIAFCCFKLGSYEKARLAAKKAVSIDPSNVDGLVMIALLEQVDAVKDKDKTSRAHHRAIAADLCSFALALDPTCSTALINLANYTFGSLKLLSTEDGAGGICIDEQTLRFSNASEVTVFQGDEIHIMGGHSVHHVVEVIHENRDLILRFQPKLSPSLVGIKCEVKIKEFHVVFDLARKAFQSTKLPQVQAESCYLQGRVFHAQGHIRDAQRLYEDSVKLWPDFTLPNFALGQLTLAQSLSGKPIFEKSLEYFEKVKQISPDDKDTQAYVIFLRGILKGEVCGIEKVKEVATAFPYEADLWILQGQLRQKNQSGFAAALRCYFYALDVMREKNVSVHALPSVLSNIAVLHHCLGRFSEAVEYSKLALAEVQRSPATISPTTGQAFVNPVFKSSDFENVFYSWSTPVCEVKPSGSSAEGIYVHAQDGMANVEFTSIIEVGDDILIGDVMHVVEVVTSDSFTARSPVRVFALDGWSNLQLSRKIVGHNFHDGTVTFCFDYARILEDAGSLRSAAELYIELCKLHPSFIECYLRLGHIAQKLGKEEDALNWLQRALQVDEDNLDALACLGDLYYRDGSSEGQSSAKNTYEKIQRSAQQEARASLSLGNLFFHASVVEDKRNSEKAEIHLKTSYKYFHKVLNDGDLKNVFAANGLGMVMAQKDELGPAREVFQKARESNTTNDDICTNLAHIHLIQDRLTEAEHAYQANLKALIKSNRSIEVGAVNNLCEAMAFAQFKHCRHEDSLRSLLRGIHQEPNMANNGLRNWYNIAVVRLALATSIMSNKKTQKTATSVLNATSELLLAQNLFKFLANQHSTEAFEKDAAKNEFKCSALAKTFKDHLQDAFRADEKKKAERKRQEEEHSERIKAREDVKQRALQSAEQTKRDKQKAAEDRAKRLEEMKEKWVTVPQSSTSDKKDKKGSNADNDVVDSDDEEDDGLAFLNNISDGKEKLTTTDETDLFGGDDDDDDDLAKDEEDIFGDSVAMKKRKLVVSDEGDDDGGDLGSKRPKQ